MQEGCAADTELSESGFLKDFSNSQFELGPRVGGGARVDLGRRRMQGKVGGREVKG